MTSQDSISGLQTNLSDPEKWQRRHAEVVGVAPRLPPESLSSLSEEFIELLSLFESVNESIGTYDYPPRDNTKTTRQRIIENPDSEESLALAEQLPEIVRTLSRHVRLFRQHSSVGLMLLSQGQIPMREREMVVLRIAWRCQAPYEWGEHVFVAKRVGITPNDIEAIIQGPEDPNWNPHESALVRAVDELFDNAMISDETWAVLAESWNEQQLIELPFLVGQYQSVAYYQNSLKLRLHGGNEGLAAR